MSSGRRTGLKPKGILVSGFNATIHTASLLRTGENPGVVARSLLIWCASVWLQRDAPSAHLIRHVRPVHEISHDRHY